MGDGLSQRRGPTPVAVQPTPNYETLASLLGFWALWRWRRRIEPLRLFAAYLVLAGAERFVVEFLRIDEPVAAGLTQPQLFGAASIALGTVLLLTGPRARAVARPRSGRLPPTDVAQLAYSPPAFTA